MLMIVRLNYFTPRITLPHKLSGGLGGKMVLPLVVDAHPIAVASVLGSQPKPMNFNDGGNTTLSTDDLCFSVLGPKV